MADGCLRGCAAALGPCLPFPHDRGQAGIGWRLYVPGAVWIRDTISEIAGSGIGPTGWTLRSFERLEAYQAQRNAVSDCQSL